MADQPASTAIEYIFALTDRGLVLILEDVEGAIREGQIATGPRGSSLVSAPGYTRNVDRTSNIAVLALAQNAKDLFKVGDRLTFTMP